MKVALAQINPKVGDVSKNIELILSCIEKAKKDRADWILFPELSVVGYPPRDLLDYSSIFEESEEGLKKIKVASQGIGVIVGSLEKNEIKIGKPYFNSAFVFRDEKTLLSYQKRLLPTYDIFEDERYFEKGFRPGVFDWEGKRFGVAICEDIWNRNGFLDRLYDEDPIYDLKKQNLSALFVLSASPFELGKPEKRKELVSEIAKDLKASVIYCNQAAANDELIFDGSSLVADPSGRVVASLKSFQSDMQIWEEEKSCLQLWPDKASDWLKEALVFGLKDYLDKSNQRKICLGLSGGIDSSVAAVLAVEAVGKENVLGVSLPSPFTSEASKEDARALADNLGIRFLELEIESIFESFTKTLAPIQPTGLTLENIQPRIRMTLLMGLANQEGSLLLNTSNKSELATGYSTLYGDSAGALSILGDLTKAQVRELAEGLNFPKKVIPHRVIDRPPSAELKPNQKDEDTLPPYSELDPIVEASLVHQLGPKELIKRGFSKEWVGLFSRLHAFSEYKRKQMPPVLRVSPKAFGMGRRIPLSCRHYADK
jgi:NAD+ synthetase